MMQARAAFQAQLRDAVRHAHAPQPPVRPQSAAAAPATRRGRFVLRLWLPLTPLWVLLAPFALLATPLLLAAPPLRGVRPFRAAFGIGAALFALSGTVIDVQTPDAEIRLRIL
ncbi:MAG TPA: hypothetical protein VFE13_17815 [Caulobacteraceae bacterium]|jgi:hypothetical protein|nr:hypothetical protein [Caulobacteraceae bacterium]